MNVEGLNSKGSGNGYRDFSKNSTLLAKLKTTVTAVSIRPPAAPTLDVVLKNKVREEGENAGNASSERAACYGVDTRGTDVREERSKKLVKMCRGEIATRTEAKDGSVETG